MTAEEYLKQLQALKVRVDQLQKEKARLRQSLTSLSSIDYSKDRVSGGMVSSDASYANKIMRILEIDEEINNHAAEYNDLRNKIVGQIHNLQNANHIKLLYKRYVEDKPLKKIAKEMNYTYDYVRAMHSKALEEFENTHIISH